MGEKMGYARVSTKEQNLDRQLIKFKELGIPEDWWFTDKQSGKNFEREKYQLMRGKIRAGDLIYMDALDRLGRDYDGIIKEWKYITREKNADIVILENEMFDSRKFKAQGDIGKVMEDMFLGLLAYLAEQQRKKTLTTQKEGIAAAHARGQKFGAPRVQTDERFSVYYRAVKAGEMLATDAWKALGLTKATWYRRVKEHENALGLPNKRE